jgi:hypothetical protein
MELLEDFAIEKLGLIENDIAAMMDKLDIFQSSLRRDDELLRMSRKELIMFVIYASWWELQK